MKWIGQHIYDQISRFRNHTYFEDSVTLSTGKSITMDEYTSGTISITKVQDSGTTFNDNDTSLMTAGAIADKIEAYGYSTTAGDITSVVAGIGLSGGATSGAATLNVDAAQTQITSVGTIGTGTWQGTAIANTYLDADTAHLTTNQTFSGVKTFSAGIITDGNQTVTPGDGAAIHVDFCDITDGNTSGSGTAAKYTHVNIEAPRLAATNESVTTTDAATLYVQAAPVTSTNQTITNPWALWVDSGNARFDGNIDLEGDMDVNGTLETDALTVGGTNVLTGSLITTLGTISAGVWNGTAIGASYVATLNQDTTGEAGTVATIAGLAPNTATTQASQPNITGVGTIGTGVWQGTAIASAYIADDAVTFAKASGVTPNVYGSVIKLIPSDFMANDDGGNTKFGVGYVDHAGDTTYGMRTAHNIAELFAFVSIPEGMKATDVHIHAKSTYAVAVFECQINASSMSALETGSCNTSFTITDTDSTATNFLAIKVTTTSATNDLVWGGIVTIAAI